jgi:hypothetical protein
MDKSMTSRVMESARVSDRHCGRIAVLRAMASAVPTLVRSANFGIPNAAIMLIPHKSMQELQRHRSSACALFLRGHLNLLLQLHKLSLLFLASFLQLLDPALSPAYLIPNELESPIDSVRSFDLVLL